MGELIAARDWLTVFQLPAYASELNPVESVWSHLKRSLANLAKRDIAQLTALAKTRLEGCSTSPASSNSRASASGRASATPRSGAIRWVLKRYTIPISRKLRVGAYTPSPGQTACPHYQPVLYTADLLIRSSTSGNPAYGHPPGPRSG